MPDPASHGGPSREHPSATGPWPIAEPDSRSGQGMGSATGDHGLGSLPRSGDRLESYEILESIGVGGMGAVFRARDLKLDRLVALKILPPEQASDPENVQRFYQEGRAAARLDHENIARVFTIGHDQNHHFIAFEFIDGTNIRRRVEEQGPLSVAETINFALQIATALVHSSERGVVHRDIKPSNIIVTTHGRAKLVDMGLARRFERHAPDDGLTQSGMTLGTFDYISPEQARDPRAVDVRSDLYSLGCTMYHMLTGQPPFPGGTVLQKLLSHQEDPAPDVRALNPNVPSELAVILLKLMAKDRDRRYQTPELLVRDLFSLAGNLGLRSVSPEGLVWLNPGTPPAWERHLVWGLPALGLLLVVGLLTWFSQPPSQPANPVPSPTDRPLVLTNPPEVTPAPLASDIQATPPSTAITPPEKSLANTERTIAPAQPVVEPETRVSSSEELATALAQPGGPRTIILAEDGPYLVKPTRLKAPTNATSEPWLTLRAAPNTRPVLQPAPADSVEAPLDAAEDSAMLTFLGGHVLIDGVAIEIGGGRDPGPREAIRAEDARLTLRRSRINRSQASALGGARNAAILLSAKTDIEPTASPSQGRSVIEECFLGGEQVGVLVQGPAELWITSTRFATTEPSIWCDNLESNQPVRDRLWVRDVVMLTQQSPAFRFEETLAEVEAEGLVVGPSRRDQSSTLAWIDRPQHLTWTGRRNLFAQIGYYLFPTQVEPSQAAITSFDRWRETPAPVALREFQSRHVEVWPWVDPDPVRALADSTDPIEALRVRSRFDDQSLASREPASTPNSSQPTPSPTALAAGPEPRPETQPIVPPMPVGIGQATDTNPMVIAPMPMTRADLTSLPPIGPVPDPTSPAPDRSTRPSPPEPSDRATAQPDRPATSPDAPGDLVRTAADLRTAIQRLGDQGGTITLARSANFTLDEGFILEGDGRWQLRAEPGAGRPSIRFRDDPNRLPSTESRPLFRVAEGTLTLLGLDLIVELPGSAAATRRVIVELGPTARLDLDHTTVQILGPSRPAFARVARTGEPEPGDEGRIGSARIELVDSFLRASGDIVDVIGDFSVEVSLRDSLIASAGPLLHVKGLPRGTREPRLALEINQSTLWLEGGLVWLESEPGEPDLPHVEVLAKDSVLTTGSPNRPLFRVAGQDELDTLRDRIRWEASHVAYHRIDVYRRDETQAPGAMPVRFDRDSWEVAFGRRETEPFHGDAAFAREWTGDQPIWKFPREAARLTGSSPAGTLGVDLARIPDAPEPQN